MSNLWVLKSESIATATFASGLKYLYAAFNHLGLIRSAQHEYNYTKPELRYALRMRPLLSISIPEIPPYEEFAAHSAPTSLLLASSPNDKNEKNGEARMKSLKLQAMQLLDLAETDIRNAKVGWDEISKLPADVALVQTQPQSQSQAKAKAQAGSCEQWWRDGVKDILRSVIKAGIVTANAKKTLSKIDEEDCDNNAFLNKVRSKFKIVVDLSNAGGEDGKGGSSTKKKGKGRGYHAWWIVPDLVTL